MARKYYTKLIYGKLSCELETEDIDHLHDCLVELIHLLRTYEKVFL